MARGAHHELLARLLDSGLTDAEFDELAALLEADADARADYIRWQEAEATLHWCYGDTRRQPPEEVEPVRTPEVLRPDTGIGRRRTWLQRASRRPMGPAIAVAVIGVGALLVVLAITPVARFFANNSPSSDERKPEDAAQEIATLTGWHRIDWKEGHRISGQNHRLQAGQRVAMLSGLAEITYDTGAKVVLEGPCEFVIGGERLAASDQQSARKKTARSSSPHPSSLTLHPSPRNSGFLKLGKLLATCDTPASKGFTIATPAASVVDLGTEFVVSVNEQRSVTTHVIRGAVEVRRGGEVDRLVSGQSATIANDRVVVYATDEDSFRSQFAGVLQGFEQPPRREMVTGKILNIDWIGSGPLRTPRATRRGVAGGENAKVWNDLVTSGLGHMTALKQLAYGDGSPARGLVVEFVTPVNSHTPSSDACDLAIFDGHINTSINGKACRIKITGVDVRLTYDLYLYAARRVVPLRTQFTVGQATKKLAPSGETSRFVEGTNYVVFRGVRADENGAIEIAFDGPKGGNFSALQLVEDKTPNAAQKKATRF